MNNRIAVAGMAAVVVASSALALAGSSALAAGEDKPQGVTQSAKASKTTSGVIKCDGGKNINMRSRIVNSPFEFDETGVNDADQAVPGAQVLVNGPKHGKDTLLITFSAETQLTGGDSEDWMGLEVHDNGSPINPFTAGADKVALTGEPSWNGNSLQFCTRVGKGAHLLKTYTNLHDSSPGHDLHGWLDDYTFSVVRFD